MVRANGTVGPKGQTHHENHKVHRSSRTYLETSLSTIAVLVAPAPYDRLYLDYIPCVHTSYIQLALPIPDLGRYNVMPIPSHLIPHNL